MWCEAEWVEKEFSGVSQLFLSLRRSRPVRLPISRAQLKISACLLPASCLQEDLCPLMSSSPFTVSWLNRNTVQEGFVVLRINFFFSLVQLISGDHFKDNRFTALIKWQGSNNENDNMKAVEPVFNVVVCEANVNYGAFKYSYGCRAAVPHLCQRRPMIRLLDNSLNVCFMYKKFQWGSVRIGMLLFKVGNLYWSHCFE